jgi:hypothetical protein
MSGEEERDPGEPPSPLDLEVMVTTEVGQQDKNDLLKKRSSPLMGFLHIDVLSVCSGV